MSIERSALCSFKDRAVAATCGYSIMVLYVTNEQKRVVDNRLQDRQETEQLE